jgi:hypothetical protein
MTSDHLEHDLEQSVHRTRIRLKETMAALREEMNGIQEPQLTAMLETSAEVIGGLLKAFQDYEAKDERAWRILPRLFRKRAKASNGHSPAKER